MEDINNLLKQFDEETSMMSITHYALKLPIAKKLMDRRQEAIPAVLEYLRDGKGGMAEMTLLSFMLPDANPYQPEDVGAGFVGYKVQEAVDAWVKWGIANKWIHESCSACGSNDITHSEKVGRGLPPKDWVRKQGDGRLISWAGIWDYWTCNKCGNEVKKLRR